MAGALSGKGVIAQGAGLEECGEIGTHGCAERTVKVRLFGLSVRLMQERKMHGDVGGRVGPRGGALSRRGLLVLSGLGLALAAVGPARAGVARPIALRELVRSSRFVVRATPLEALSSWQKVGSSRRIVTDTRLRIDEQIGGSTPDSGELWVRTLGGQVGKIGQIVHGEATLQIGQASVLFLTNDPNGVLHVTALAQGHYPLRADTSGTRRLERSPHLSQLTGDGPSAVRDLVGKSLVEASELVRKAAR